MASPDAHPQADRSVVDPMAPAEPVTRFTQESPRRRVVSVPDARPGSIRAVSGLGSR